MLNRSYNGQIQTKMRLSWKPFNVDPLCQILLWAIKWLGVMEHWNRQIDITSTMHFRQRMHYNARPTRVFQLHLVCRFKIQCILLECQQVPHNLFYRSTGVTAAVHNLKSIPNIN